MAEFDLSVFNGVDLGEYEGNPTQPAVSSFSGWKIVDHDPGPEEFERFDIKSKTGLVDFGVRTSANFVIVNWEACLSAALKPSTFAELYNGLIPLLTRDLPLKMNLKEIVSGRLISGYRQNTTVELRVGSVDPINHELKTEMSAAEFAFDYFTRRNSVAGIRASVNAGRSYTLDVSYGRGEFGRDSMAITMPVGSARINSWSGSLTEWMLTHHVHSRDLGGLSQPAAGMADILQGKTREAFHRKLG